VFNNFIAAADQYLLHREIHFVARWFIGKWFERERKRERDGGEREEREGEIERRERG